MKVVIAGAGNVGSLPGRRPSQAGHEVLLMEIDPGRGPAGSGPWASSGW